MMLSKLAFRNVRKSFRDYFIYFITLTVGVCIFYVFNSIESQQSMMVITQSQVTALQTVNRIMGIVSVFISVIFGFLILYANRFLIKRRKKELGIYMTLGMEKGQISRVLMIETVFVGAFSLLAGLLLGVLLSQGLAVVTVRLFAARFASFRFIFSPSATLKAVLYFGITFAVVIAFNVFMISRQKLIHLIYADRKNESFKQPRLLLSVGLFIVAAACLLVAYALIKDNGLSRIDAEFWVSIVLGCVGTFLFFFSLSGFFLKLISGWKRVYLKNLNMFVLRQINSKINTSYISMTIVCLILFVSISTFSVGIGISTAATGELEKITPFDASFRLRLSEAIYNEAGELIDFQNVPVDLLQELAARGIDVKAFAREYAEMDYYAPFITFRFDWFGEESVWQAYVVKLSQYNALLKLQGKEPLTLGEDEFAVNSAYEGYNWQETLAAYLEVKPDLVLNGRTLTNAGMLRNALEVSFTADNDGITIVVPDDALDGLVAATKTLHMNYREPADESEELCKAAFGGLDLTNDGLNISMYRELTTKLVVYEASRNTSATVAYLAIYIGIVFLIISAAVLAITQLAEAGDNARRYGLLTKIGVENGMINRAIFAQILIYFGAPLVLALAHAAVGISVAGNIVAQFGRLNILRDSSVTAAIVIAVYGGYLVATYLGSKSLVKTR
ncbi:MAG: FtsX-like permease family protein [Oscillospiraceae bacterium]|jgi:putative ABC transport system permease protein|nr:FtsX-like permease family protein [Oscillospiraceae bacterium]